ncbi:uncharacterized protein LOC143425626 [Xylocopa sonorina]|uniref:uncharacterized protein LOC143425626 n=1 Tax=Xylocopa sonorina TaxID=1818115 RepID=UPI00403B1479
MRSLFHLTRAQTTGELHLHVKTIGILLAFRILKNKSLQVSVSTYPPLQSTNPPSNATYGPQANTIRFLYSFTKRNTMIHRPSDEKFPFPREIVHPTRIQPGGTTASRLLSQHFTFPLESGCVAKRPVTGALCNLVVSEPYTLVDDLT